MVVYGKVLNFLHDFFAAAEKPGERGGEIVLLLCPPRLFSAYSTAVACLLTALALRRAIAAVTTTAPLCIRLLEYRDSLESESAGVHNIVLALI